MAFEQIRKVISGDGPGRETTLNYYRVGPNNAEKKVYLQAAMHADEQPGILVLHHLIKALRQADRDGTLQAQFVIFPMANPLGMANINHRQHQGRYDPVSGINHNRGWPDLFPIVQSEIGDTLTQDIEQNKRRIRDLVRNWLTEQPAISALQQQRHFIMREVFDADYVFDLHCDNDSLLHIFALPQHMPELQSLADWTGAAATLVAEDSGGGSFDEVWSTLWTRMRKAHPGVPLPDCYSVTMEYRGQFETFDEINEDDAERLFCYFQSRGLIQGLPSRKRAVSPPPSDLTATQVVRAKQPGLLAYKVALGDIVKKGQTIADLITIEGDDAFQIRTPIIANTDGLVLSRSINKYVWPTKSIAKIVGTETLEDRDKYLLED
ncbi:MAG: succinylglutamate desuccinylase [Gammaproteobacteria bacterium]|nr:succinylglutamate desuccinylase [Gammaproteobacteria bacterium]